MHSVNETKAPLEYDVDGFGSHSELENEWEGRLLLLRQNIDISLLLVFTMIKFLNTYKIPIFQF